MEYLSEQYTLELSGEFPLSTDSMVLSDFVRLPRDARVLDFGSGCGTLGLLLCAKDSRCAVTGIELEPSAHEAALGNIARNGLSHRLQSICADLRTWRPEQSGSFDVCLSNPPYFSGGAAHSRHTTARREDTCTPAELFTAAGKALRFGGDFFLVHKPERLAELITAASAAGLEPKRLRLVRHSPDKPISLILLSCRKGAKPGLRLEELTLYHPDGSPTEDCRRIYHL